MSNLSVHHPVAAPSDAPAVARYHRLANRLLGWAAMGMLLGVVVAYPWAHRFPFGVQILAHLTIPVAAGALKLGYVMRLATTPNRA